MIFLAVVLLLLTSCGSIPFLGGGDPPAGAPPRDVGAELVSAIPEIADSGARLLSTFVYTAVVVALVFPAARLAAVGVFVAFYDRIASWFRPKYRKSSYVEPSSRLSQSDEPEQGDPPSSGG